MIGIDKITGLFSKFLIADEVFTLYAQVVSKAVDALVKEGFTRKEAISIVSGMIKGMV